MQEWLISYLACPACRSGGLRVQEKHETRFLAGDPRTEPILVSGILGCDQCGTRYPVLDEAPRLLPRERLTPDEIAILDQTGAAPREGGVANQWSPTELDDFLAATILSEYGNPTSGPGLRRAKDDIEYQRRYSESRVYQMKLLHRLVGTTPVALLDVGGGRGGNLIAAQEALAYQYGITVDLNLNWPRAFMTGDRRRVYLRADATRLPLRSQCLDLAVSSFLLEHVKQWQGVVDEVLRVSRTAFIAFGPNRHFPYEIGHLDAPLVHCLPPSSGAMAGSLWASLTGKPRTYQRTREILGEMCYISSREYYAFCRSRGYVTRSIFTDILLERMGRGAGEGRPRQGLYNALVRRAAQIIDWVGVEPNVYSIVTPPSRG